MNLEPRKLSFVICTLLQACSTTGVQDLRSEFDPVPPEDAQPIRLRDQLPFESSPIETELPVAFEHSSVVSKRPDTIERPWVGPAIALDRLAFSRMPESPEEEDRWSSFLPLLGDKAREKGYELPYPFGIGVTALHISRPTDVTSVRAGTNNNPLQEISFLQFEAQANVSTIIGRFDTWILPLLNVYLLGGYIWNESTVSVLADLPGAPGTPVTFPGKLEGPMFGGGATLAGGYKKFFSTLDVNFTRSQLGALSEFEAFLSTIRMGYSTSIGGSDLRFWTGATHWDTARTIEGTIPLSGLPGVSSVSFAVDQEPDDPWTLILGSTVTVSKSFWLLFELQGWEDTRAITAGAAFRF